MKTKLGETLGRTWNDTGFQRYFQNTGWLFGSRILSLLISFFATIFIARNLGPTNFGQLSYAVSFVSLFSFLATLGIDTIVYRDLIKNQDNKDSILGSALAIKVVASVVAAFLVIFSATFFAKDVSTVLIVILSGTFIFNSFQIINYQFQATSQSKYPAIITILVTVILNILKVAAIYFDKGVIYLSLILLLESILYALFFLFIYNKKFKHTLTKWTPSWPIIQSLLKDSWPLIFSGAFALIYSRIDQIFIKHMLGAESVGIYDAAVKLAEVWYFIPGIIVTALFPAIINAKKISEELYLKRIQKLALFLVSFAVMVAGTVTIFAPYIMNLLYGHEFFGGVIVLQIYVWAGVGVFLGTLAINYLVTENYRKILFFISFLPMITNIVLNILWIPVFGIAGAAYATLVSYLLTPFSLFFFKETRHVFFRFKKSA